MFFADLRDDGCADVARQLTTRCGATRSALDDHTVAEAMDRRVSALPHDAPGSYAAAVMRRAGVQRVLVIDGSDLVGVVTATAIVEAMADHG